jgi:hypothetical protein
MAQELKPCQGVAKLHVREFEKKIISTDAAAKTVHMREFRQECVGDMTCALIYPIAREISKTNFKA